MSVAPFPAVVRLDGESGATQQFEQVIVIAVIPGAPPKAIIVRADGKIDDISIYRLATTYFTPRAEQVPR